MVDKIIQNYGSHLSSQLSDDSNEIGQDEVTQVMFLHALREGFYFEGEVLSTSKRPTTPTFATQPFPIYLQQMHDDADGDHYNPNGVSSPSTPRSRKLF